MKVLSERNKGNSCINYGNFSSLIHRLRLIERLDLRNSNMDIHAFSLTMEKANENKY